MAETTTEFDAHAVCVELPELDSLDIGTPGLVRVASGDAVICITIPVDLGVLGDTIAITLPLKEIHSHLARYDGEINR